MLIFNITISFLIILKTSYYYIKTLKIITLYSVNYRFRIFSPICFIIYICKGI